jgi:uncharacterized protein with NRDE domain
MCLLIAAHRACPGYRLIVAANRDEFHGRATAAAEHWSDQPAILAGRDLEGGGTWLGLNVAGRFATVTNVRSANPVRRGPRSRGLIVSDFLLADHDAHTYVRQLMPAACDYDGFNLLAWDGSALSWLSNQASAPRTLSPGIYALSNAMLDTPWPKTERLRRTFMQVMDKHAHDPVPALLAVLRDTAQADDTQLPDTGIGADRERWLSSIFIEGETYGTRCSSVLTISDAGQVNFHERRYDRDAQTTGDSRFAFVLADTHG